VNIAILGYGTEGKALAKYFKRRKANITIFDQSEDVEIPNSYKKTLGVDAFSVIGKFDAVYKSPGIPMERIPPVDNLTNLMQFFFANCPCPIIGVTGTKGKGTTATLIYEILKEAGHDAYLGGNIGNPPIEFLTKLKKSSVVVLEISSFQAQLLKQSPQMSVILMTTSDHMDHHADIKEYHEAKANLTKHQNEGDITIANVDYKYSTAIGKETSGQLFTLSTKKNVAKGAQLDGKKVVLKLDGKSVTIMNVKDVALIGAHNLENVLAAATATALYDVDPKTIQKVISEFTGLPHRLEFVKKVKGAHYYNDSFSVNPEASIAGMRAFKEPLILIAGGYERHAEFGDWAKAVVEQKNLKMLILTGKQSAVRMFEELREVNTRKNLKILRLLNVREAVIAAKTYAEKDDIVLLSPGCPSFDEFTDYKERGETFKALL
jgi:UDP-N-acetylmuramoylalanine--D-glutamate ligase